MKAFAIIIAMSLVGCAPPPAQVVQVENADGTVSTVQMMKSTIKIRHLGEFKDKTYMDAYLDETNGVVCYVYSSYGISCVKIDQKDLPDAEQP